MSKYMDKFVGETIILVFDEEGNISVGGNKNTEEPSFICNTQRYLSFHLTRPKMEQKKWSKWPHRELRAFTKEDAEKLITRLKVHDSDKGAKIEFSTDFRGINN